LRQDEFVKASQKTDPRTRILAVADRLFYTEGVRATGTEKIMSVSSVAKATFYRHFESKDALVLAYLDNRDQSFWDYLFNPDRPKNVYEALARIDRLVNRPEVTGCPFLLVASEYPDPAHPIHRRVVEHKDKLLAYLIELLKPFGIDQKAAAAKLLIVIDGALSLRLLYGSTRQAPLLSSASAILEAFQKPRSSRSSQKRAGGPGSRPFSGR
jgi:AcrR family transcriptional regulator